MIKLQENVSLAPYTTFKIGGLAKYFYEAQTKADVVVALDWAKQNNLKYFILSGGSNVLFSDEGFDGLVIKLALKEIKVRDNILYAEAGAKLMVLVKEALDNGLVGLEFLAGIPGEVGGAIRGNAGAFGSEIKDFVKIVEVIRNGEIKSLRAAEVTFGYRESMMKHNKDVILSGEFELTAGNMEESEALVKKNIEYRRTHHPTLPSAGCIFKNPVGTTARELIKKVGLDGYMIGGAKISDQHCNFIVNLGSARAVDVKKLINLAKERVKDKFGIELEEEVVIL